METPYSRLVNAMREEGEYNNSFEMAVCVVASVDPLAISYNDVLIDHNIYCNEGWIYPEDPLEEILAGEEYVSEGFKSYLNDLNRKLKIQAGDMVMVQRVGNSFLVLGKAVIM